jgi:hypothetical protein
MEAMLRRSAESCAWAMVALSRMAVPIGYVPDLFLLIPEQ